MEVDTSSTSSDSSAMFYKSNPTESVYAENLLGRQTQKCDRDFDGFFSKDGVRADDKVANVLKKVDYFQGKKEHFIITITNNPNRNSYEEIEKNTFSFKDNFGVKQISECFVQGMKSHVECLSKLNVGDNMNLSNVEEFEKKSMNFTADQVNLKSPCDI